MATQFSSAEVLSPLNILPPQQGEPKVAPDASLTLDGGILEDLYRVTPTLTEDEAAEFTRLLENAGSPDPGISNSQEA